MHAPSAATHVAEWMLEAALGVTTASEAFVGMVERLRDQGVQIDRAHLTYTTLHPLNRGAGLTWTRQGGLETQDYAIESDAIATGWYDSPIYHIIRNRIPRLRRRLSGPGSMLDFSILETFAEQGNTDYLLFALPFESFFVPVNAEGDPDQVELSGMAVSFCTSRPSGFTDEELGALDWLVRPLAMMVKMADQRQVAVNLANCYIGREAGPRVLGGAIRRGDFASTPAVVWLSDMRASTEMSMALPREEFVKTINDFFDCTAGAVEVEGGEPLNFIGDGTLAIFPIETLGELGAREAAMKAAARATEALGEMNRTRLAEGRPQLGYGIALHAGVLEYGNIGSLTRHSWSAIGSVVNETARLEGTSKEVGEPLVASRNFVDGIDGAWRSMGQFVLKGVPEEFEVFAPPLDLKILEETAA